jgi:phage gp29-like protein
MDWPRFIGDDVTGYLAAKRARARVAFVHRRAGVRRRLRGVGRAGRRLAALLRPPRKARKPPGGLVAPATWLQRTTHPERGLTVEDITRVLDEAERGRLRAQVDLITNLLERDPATRNLFEQRANAVTGKPFTVMAGADDADSERAAALLGERLERAANLGAMFEHLLSFNVHGFASCQILWQLADGAIAPAWFAPVHQSCFCVAQPGDGNVIDGDELLLVTDRAPRGERLAPGQWISVRRSPTLPVARSGLGRTATFYMLFKLGAVRDLAIFVHRFGVPFPLARCNWTDQDSREAAEAMVENFGRDGGGVVSDRVQVEFPEPATGRTGTVHPALVALCDAQMAKLVNGVTLANDNAGSGGASYALSRTHADVRWENIVRDAVALQDAFARDIARPFMIFNGLRGAPPRLRIQVVQALHPRDIVEIAAIMRNQLGLDVDEAQIRSMIGLKGPVRDVRDARQREAA